MAQSEIPDDIRAAAMAIRDKLCIDCECTFDRGCGCLNALHEALLAERERCADIVQPFTVQGGTGGAFVRKAMWSVLDAIRQQEPSK